MQRNIFTAFLSIAGGRAAVLIISAATTPLLFRYLGESAYGQYGTVMAIFGMLMILASSGINSGVRKYLAEERDSAGWERHVFGFYFQVATALALLAAVVLALAAWTGFVASVLDPAYVPLFYLLAVLALASQFREYVRRALMGLKLEHVSEPLKVAHKLTFAVVGIGLAVLGHGVWGVLVGEIVASTLVFLVALTFIAREISPFAVFDLPPKNFPWKELFTFNYLTVVYIFLLTSMYHVDVIMLEMLGTSAQAGVYRAGLVLVQFLWFVPRSVQSVMIQSASSLWAEENIEKINELSSKVTRYTLLLTLLLAIGLGALASDFVPLYYGNADIVLPVLLLLPGTVGFAVARPILAINHAKGALKIVILATGTSAMINLGLNRILIPQYGIAGAAIATSIGYGTLPLFHIWGARETGYQPLADVRLVRTAVTAVLAGVPTVALAMAIENPFLAMVVVPPVGLVLYSAAAFLTGAVHVDEVLAVLTSLPAPISSWARSLRARLDSGDVDPIAPTREQTPKVIQYGLLALGILLFAAGLAMAIGGPTGDLLPGGNSTDGPPGTDTPIVTGTPTDGATAATATPGGTPSPKSTPDQTDTRPGAENPTATATPSPTATPTDDDGFLGWGGGGDNDDSTPTPTATPSPSPTPTPGTSPTATASPTPSSSTPSPSPTPTATLAPGTATSSPSPTATATPTPTGTFTSTATPTPTATSGGTNTTSQSMAAPVQLFAELFEWLF